MKPNKIFSDDKSFNIYFKFCKYKGQRYFSLTLINENISKSEFFNLNHLWMERSETSTAIFSHLFILLETK